MQLYKRLRNFIEHIGTSENSKIKNIIDFLLFVISTSGLRLIKNKVYQKLFNLDKKTYNSWIQNKLDIKKLQSNFNSTFPTLTFRPLISIVIPVYNPPINLLEEAIKSIINQLYTNWEICLADDNSTDVNVDKLLAKYASEFGQIKYIKRNVNGHISACSNSALELVKGEYILFMDHDDLLTPDCLFEVIKHLNKTSDDIIYSDEDKIDEKGCFSSPHFKPDWAPENLLSRNYLGHVIVMSKKIVDALNGFRLGFEGSQDYDLLLRATEITNKIGHIPKILYHWRIHKLSVAKNSDVKPYAYNAAIKALEEALQRRKRIGKVERIPDAPGGYRIKYEIQFAGKVSIIIPTKDQTNLLRKTLNSIIEFTNYHDYEIILLNNNSTSNEFFELVKEYKMKYVNIFTCYDASFPFNFSKLMNFGASKAEGKYLLFLNNDVEIIQNDWMSQMVSFSQWKQTGAVGVKLLFENNTIQHAGVVIGLGGSAAHVFTNLPKQSRGYFNYIKSLNNYSAVTAACMMCRLEQFIEVNGFDEDLPVEYNDIDFCLKLLVKGYYNLYIPDVELFHYESSTRSHPYHSKHAFAQHEKDISVFRKKWMPFIENDPFYNPNLRKDTNDFKLNLKS